MEATEILLARIDQKVLNIDKNLAVVVSQIDDHSQRIGNIEVNCAATHGPKGDRGERGDEGRQGIQVLQGVASSKAVLALVSGGNTVLFIVILLLLEKFGIL